MAIHTLHCVNDSVSCGIKINCSWSGEPVGNADTIKILARKLPDGQLKEIFRKTIASGSDIACEIMDYGTASCASYRYFSYLMNGETAIESDTSDVACVFSGVALFDGTHAYTTDFGIAGGEYRFEVNKNYPVQFVTTLKGKYPHQVRNSDAFYSSGSVNGWFTERTECGEPVIDNFFDYIDRFQEFLCNGKIKILKNGDGRMFLVQISNPPKENYHAISTLTTITFEWVEVGRVDVRSWVKVM